MATLSTVNVHVHDKDTFADSRACRHLNTISMAVSGCDAFTLFISPTKAIELASWLIEQASECGVEAETAAPLSATMPVAANAGGVEEWGY